MGSFKGAGLLCLWAQGQPSLRTGLLTASAPPAIAAGGDALSIRASDFTGFGLSGFLFRGFGFSVLGLGVSGSGV